MIVIIIAQVCERRARADSSCVCARACCSGATCISVNAVEEDNRMSLRSNVIQSQWGSRNPFSTQTLKQQCALKADRVGFVLDSHCVRDYVNPTYQYYVRINRSKRKYYNL